MTWLLMDLRDGIAQRAEQLRAGGEVDSGADAREAQIEVLDRLVERIDEAVDEIADVVREGGLPADLVRVWPIP